jgi:hypothetical protein
MNFRIKSLRFAVFLMINKIKLVLNNKSFIHNFENVLFIISTIIFQMFIQTVQLSDPDEI